MHVTRRFIHAALAVSASLGAANCGSEATSPGASLAAGDGGLTKPDGGNIVPVAGCDAGLNPALPASRTGSPSCSMSRGPGIAPDGGGDSGTEAGHDGGTGSTSCASDADCIAGQNGRCAISGGNAAGLFCTYDECFTDSDCASGSVCSCGTRVASPLGANICVPSTCARDSDCGAGFTCAASGNFQCANYDQLEGYYCHSKSDECQSDCDCGGDGPGEPAGACRYDPTGSKWSCVFGECSG